MADGYVETKLFGGALTANIPVGFFDVSTIRPVPDHQEIYLSSTGLTSIAIDINERVDPYHPNNNPVGNNGVHDENANTNGVGNRHRPPADSVEEEDLKAFRIHFRDILTGGDIAHIWGFQRFPNPSLGPDLQTLCAAMFTPIPSSSPPPPPPPPSSTPYYPPQPPRKTTVLLLTLIRLGPQSADLTISVSIPLPHQDSEPGPPSLPQPAAPPTPNPHEPPTRLGYFDQPGPEATEEKREEVKEGKIIAEEVVRSLKIVDWTLFEAPSREEIEREIAMESIREWGRQVERRRQRQLEGDDDDWSD